MEIGPFVVFVVGVLVGSILADRMYKGHDYETGYCDGWEDGSHRRARGDPNSCYTRHYS